MVPKIEKPEAKKPITGMEWFQTENADLKPNFLYKVIDMHGRGGFLSIGDLNGDGIRDFVSTQGTKFMTAFDINGNVFWQKTRPDGEIRVHAGCQMPTTIYDIDQDGENEVICRWYLEGDNQQYLFILDGATGNIERKIAWSAGWPDTFEVGKIVIANLRGLDQPQDILAFRDQSQLSAYDHTLNLLWGPIDFSYIIEVGPIGQPEYVNVVTDTCHMPYPEDIDGDGRDELICGGKVLDDNGQLLWGKDVMTETDEADDHVDSLWVGDIDDNPANGKEIVWSTGGCLLNSTGEFLWKKTDLISHGQRVKVGDLRPDIPGKEIVILNIRSETNNYNYIFSCDGEQIAQCPEGHQDLADVTGDGIPEIAIVSEFLGIFDVHGNVLATFPPEDVIHTDYGYHYDGICEDMKCCDVLGDWRDEVMFCTEDLVIIYYNTAPNPNNEPYRSPEDIAEHEKNIYNTTRY